MFGTTRLYRSGNASVKCIQGRFASLKIRLKKCHFLIGNAKIS